MTINLLTAQLTGTVDQVERARQKVERNIQLVDQAADTIAQFLTFLDINDQATDSYLDDVAARVTLPVNRLLQLIQQLKATPVAPVPMITSLSPMSVPVGSPGITLTINGSGFALGSVVMWNGQPRPTLFVSPTQLTAQLSAGDLASGMTAVITVQNPGQISGGSNFQVGTPPALPVITSLNPSSLTVPLGADTIVQVAGSNFTSNSVVQVNGQARVTSFVSPTQLNVTVLATDAQTSGILIISVNTPGVGLSNSVQLALVMGAPAITAISPTSGTAGQTTPVILTVSGSNFSPMSVVQVNGQNRVTTFVGPGQLTATILVSDLATPGQLVITVNTPGSGTSNSVNFAVS